MLISRKKNSKLPPLCITVGGTPLTLVSSVGLQFHSDLSWSPHVANLCIYQNQEAHWPSLPLIWQACMLTPPLSSNFTNLSFVLIWSTAQLFGIPISLGTLNHLKRCSVLLSGSVSKIGPATEITCTLRAVFLLLQ